MKFTLIRYACSRHRLAWLLLATVLFALLSGEAGGPQREYEIKAAFLYKFARFVEWPAESFPESDTPIRIGILGEDPFKTALDDMVRTKTVRERRLEVLRSSNAEELKPCHIVFVAASKAGEIDTLSDVFNKAHILTVGDTKGFAEGGGTINLIKEQDKVRFEINTESAQSAGLKISSQLLGLARIVKTKPKETAEHAAN